jgi:hypothetical protein
MDNLLAYIDESGGHGFNLITLGQLHHFVICAILIEEKNNDIIASEFDTIKSKYFPVRSLNHPRLVKMKI